MSGLRQPIMALTALPEMANELERKAEYDTRLNICWAGGWTGARYGMRSGLPGWRVNGIPGGKK